jgi:hypothetical protein
MALIGPHGSGKTARVDRAVELARLGGGFEVIRVDLHGNFDESIQQTVLSVVLQLREFNGVEMEDGDPIEFEERDDIDVGKRIGGEIDDVLRIRIETPRSDSEMEVSEGEQEKVDEDAMDIDEPREKPSRTKSTLTDKNQNSSAHDFFTNRRVVIVVEEFDRFLGKDRQTLFYALLELVSFTYRSKFVSIVAVTSNLDAVNLLEKRVKSRFRQAQSITFYVRSDQDVVSIMEKWLLIPEAFILPESLIRISQSQFAEFQLQWNTRVLEATSSKLFQNAISRMFKWTKDLTKFILVLEHQFLRLFKHIETPPFLDPFDFESVVLRTFPDDCIEVMKYMSELEYSFLITMALRERNVMDPYETFNFEDLFGIYEAKFKGLSSNEENRGLFHPKAECLKAFEGIVSRGLLSLPSNQRTASKLALAPVRPNFFENQLKIAMQEADAAFWLRNWLSSSAGV